MKEFNRLVDVMHKLRAECPWDKEQSILSLRTYLIEEAYECLDAMNAVQDRPQDLIEELGDLLLQIVFQSEILSEQMKKPVIIDVVTGITEKLIRRHPHVFAEVDAQNAKQVLENWEEIKKKEKGENTKSLFDGFKATGTSLMTALKIGQKSERVRFDWDHADEVWTQVEQEISELQEAASPAHREEEFGDLLFCLTQWARHQNIDPEAALQAANQKFLRRFKWMESEADKQKQEFKELSRDQKEELWKKAKKATQN